MAGEKCRCLSRPSDNKGYLNVSKDNKGCLITAQGCK